MMSDTPHEHVGTHSPSHVDTKPALGFAARNRDSLGLESRLELRMGTLCDVLAAGELFDVVVSNPPYVAETDRGGLQAEVVDWEPEEALFAGADGLGVLRELAGGAVDAVRPGGLVALEVGDGQAAEVARLLEETSAYTDIRTHKDLAGKKRIVTAVRKVEPSAEGG